MIGYYIVVRRYTITYIHISMYVFWIHIVSLHITTPLRGGVVGGDIIAPDWGGEVYYHDDNYAITPALHYIT